MHHFLCCLSLYHMYTLYSSDCKVYMCSDIQLYQSLTLPTVELCLCVWSKSCVPPQYQEHESTYIDVQHRHLSYKKKKKTYHNQWTHVCTFVKTLKINSTLDSQVSC